MDQRATDRTAEFDDLGDRVRARRKDLGLSLRAASADIGVSFNTLARVERGHLPDLGNFRRITAWLGDRDAEPARSSTTEAIAAHLRTDPLLPRDAAERIASIVKDLYGALAKTPADVPVHLRAAKTFAPDASRLLGDLLERMHRRLHEEAT